MNLVSTFFFVSDYIFYVFLKYFAMILFFFLLLLLFLSFINEGKPLIPNLNTFEFPP